MKKLLIGIVIFVVAAAGVILVVGSNYFPDNVAETAPDGGAKQLKTRYYDSDVATVRKACKEAVGGLTSWGSSWELVDQTDGGESAGLKVEVPVVVFTDDLEVTIKENDEGKVQVDVRSQSRVGKSDFGENARSVNKFLNALDQKMKNP